MHIGLAFASLAALALVAGCDAGSGASSPPAGSIAREGASAPSAQALATSASAIPAPDVAPSAIVGAQTISGAVAASAAPGSASASAPGTASASAPANGVMPPGAADAILKTGSPPIVHVLDAGKGPRTPLVYAFTKGDRQVLDVALDMKMSMSSPGRAMPSAAIPRMVMTLDLLAKELSEGRAKVDATIQGLSIVPQGQAQEAIAAEMRPQLDSVKGLGMSYWVAPQGTVHDVKIALPEGAPAASQQTLESMSQSFESMVAPLPGAPVGAGAVWEVVSRVSSAGADILQYATYTLTSRKGDDAEVDVALRQVAASERVKVPGGMEVIARLRSFTSSGKGTMAVRTTQIAPVRGALTVDSTMAIEVTADVPGVQDPAATKQQFSIESSLAVTLSRPKK